ncbi:MAG: ABC transporter permease [Thermoplasmata archaeon]
MAGNRIMDRHSRNLLRWAMFFSPSIFLILIIIVPVANLFSIFPEDLNIASLFRSGAVSRLGLEAIYNSTVQGSLSALFSFAAGFPLGLFLGRYRFRFKRFFRSMIVLPFFLPSIVVVIAFISVFGASSFLGSRIFIFRYISYGLPGIVAVNTFFNAPLVAFLTSIAIERTDRSLEESARTLGAGTLRIFRTVWGREGILAGLSGALLGFLYSFAGFTAPLIIGGTGNFTIEAWIYFLVKTLGNVNLGVIFSLFQTVILVIPVLIYSLIWMKERRVTGTQEEAFEKPVHGKWHRAGKIYLYIFSLTELFILGSVLVSSVDVNWGTRISFSGYIAIFGSTIHSTFGISPLVPFLNTVFYGALTAIFSTLLGIMWITGKRRLKVSPDSIMDSFQFIPLVIPGIVMAFSVSIMFQGRISSGYTWILIVLVQTAVAVPIVLRIISSGFSRIPDSMWEAPLTLGGNAFFEIELPLAGSALGTALMFGFAISMGEFTATNFLSTYTFMPLSVEIYSLQSLKMVSASYAAASLLLMLSFLFFYIIQRIGENFIAVR